MLKRPPKTDETVSDATSFRRQYGARVGRLRSGDFVP